MPLFRRFKPAAKLASFAGSTSANVALAFALALPVLLMGVGVAIDYSRAAALKADLQTAVDAAALTVAESSATSHDARQVIARNYVKAAFVYQNNVSDVYISETDTDSTHFAVNASAEIQNSFMKMVGNTRTTVHAMAQATAAPPPVKYVDFYVLADVSDSMGLGASPSDQTGMTNSMGCAFGCHVSNTDTIAHNNGYTLRIDALKTALQNVVTSAKSYMVSNPGLQIRFHISAFATNYQVVLPISASYGTTTDTGTGTIYGAINSLKLGYGETGWNTGGLRYGTTLPYAIDQMKAAVPTSGDGLTSATPKTFVILATDGVMDAYNLGTPVSSNWSSYVPAAFIGTTGAVDGTGNGGSVKAGIACQNYVALENDFWDTSPSAMFSAVPTPCSPEASSTAAYSTVDYQQGGGTGFGVLDQMYIGPIDPAWCDGIKSKGVNMMTLYMTYYIPPNLDFSYMKYTTFAVVPKIQPNMVACATKPSFAFSGNDTTSINAAMQSMFGTALGAAGIRLDK